MGRQFVLGLGIAATLAAMIHFGINTLYPKPEWRDYQIADYGARYEAADEEEKQALFQARSELNRKFLDAKASWSDSYFYWAVPLSIVVLLVAGGIRHRTVATGLIGGALVTLAGAYAQYWADLTSVIKFASLVLVFVVLLLLAYDKLDLWFEDGEAPPARPDDATGDPKAKAGS